MNVARNQQLTISDDLELTPGTYYAYVEAGPLLVALTQDANLYNRWADRIATDTGLNVVVDGLPFDDVFDIPAGALVAVRLRVPGAAVESQAGVLAFGVIIAALAAVAALATLQIKRLEKEIIETIPDDAIVNTSRGIMALGFAALVAALGGLYVVLRE